MGMVRSAAVDGVDLVALRLEELAEVAIPACLWKQVERSFGVPVVDVANRLDLESDPVALLDVDVTDTAEANPLRCSAFRWARCALPLRARDAARW